MSIVLSDPVSDSDLNCETIDISERPTPESQLDSGGHGLGRLPELALAMAIGSLIVAVAFAGARSNHHWSKDLDWVGEVAIFAVPAAFLLLRRTILKVEAIGIAFLMPVTSYLILLYYSPTRFLFLDEFAHVQTARTILSTHHLFHPNTYLAVSPQYPGLEIVTTAIDNTAHLSVTASGLIVAGVSHVLAGLCVYFIVSEVSGNSRVSGLAAVLYATSPHYQFFDSYFIYETIAIPFLLLTLLAVVKMLRGEGRSATVWGTVAIVNGGVTAVCHHVTSYLLIALLVAFCTAQLILPRLRWTWRLPTVTMAIVAIVAVWDLKIANKTVAYFKPSILSALGHKKGIHLAAPISSAVAVNLRHVIAGNPPPFDQVTEYLSILLLLALTLIGCRRVWINRNVGNNAAALGLGVASLGLVLVVVGRVLTGQVLASRALTFAMIPVSFVCALAIDHIRASWTIAHRHSRWRRLLRRIPVLGVAAIVVIAVGGVTGGYPNFYARLPVPFEMAAWERSVDDHNLDAAAWAATTLTRGNGIASDYFTGQIMDSLGYQSARREVADLFLTLKYTNLDREIVRKYRVTYVVVDRRITKLPPIAGYYFANDPFHGLYSAPLPRASIDKFNNVPLVSRVFDDGTIVIYDVKGTAAQ